MRRLSRRVLASCSVAVSLGSFLIALELSAAATSASLNFRHQIDRTLKSDRLTINPAAHPGGSSASKPKLPDGCITASEAHHRHIYTAEIAGRCVA